MAQRAGEGARLTAEVSGSGDRPPFSTPQHRVAGEAPSTAAVEVRNSANFMPLFKGRLSRENRVWCRLGQTPRCDRNRHAKNSAQGAPLARIDSAFFANE